MGDITEMFLAAHSRYNIILKVVGLTFYLEGLEENDVAQKGTYRGVKSFLTLKYFPGGLRRAA
jgi:hypothetical protein